MEIHSISLKIAVLVFICFSTIFFNCDHSNNSVPPIVNDPNRLLTDEELNSVPDPYAPYENKNFTSWINKNYIPIRSLSSSDYSDLQFLKTYLQGKKIVQLGENTWSTAEFNNMKIRIIKFLQKELGFDVLAFQTSIFESFYVLQNADILGPQNMMINSINDYKLTKEMLSLFQYLYENKNNTKPLNFIGFDNCISSKIGIQNRPKLFYDVISKIDQSYAKKVYSFDSSIVYMVKEYWRPLYEYVRIYNGGPGLIASYDSLTYFIDSHKSSLAQAFSSDPRIPLIARQAAWSMSEYVKQLMLPDNEVYKVADKAMAENLEFIMKELYPDQKIIIWGNNINIRYKNEATSFVPKVVTMGTYLSDKHRSDMYTIGFYMYRGKYTGSNGVIYDVPSQNSGSLESIVYRVLKKYLFFDISLQNETQGNEWLFESIFTKDNVNTLNYLVLKEQYDGIIFINEVSPVTFYTGSLIRNY